MPVLGGCGFVAIWNDVVAGQEADFAAWHAEEHMPERLALPGFLRGTRWGSAAARPRYFTLYTLAGPEIARSPQYLERLNSPTPWTRKVMSGFLDNKRCVGGFIASAGAEQGGAVVIVRFDGDNFRFSSEAFDAALASIAGVSGYHLGLADAAASALPTAERAGRDVGEPWGVGIVCLQDDADSDEVFAALAARLPKGAAGEISAMALQLDRRAAATV